MEAQHPSYGIVTLVRRQSNVGKVLFGSAAKHEVRVAVRISTARHTRKLNTNWYHADKGIVEIELSLAQFSQFIMSSGQGEGVPCTITYRQGEGYIEECPPVNTREVFTGEIKEALEVMRTRVKELENEISQLIEKPKLSAEDKRKLISLTRKLSSSIGGDIEFLKTCFQEEMDSTLNEAKIELENFSSSLGVSSKQISGS